MAAEYHSAFGGLEHAQTGGTEHVFNFFPNSNVFSIRDTDFLVTSSRAASAAVSAAVEPYLPSYLRSASAFTPDEKLLVEVVQEDEENAAVAAAKAAGRKVPVRLKPLKELAELDARMQKIEREHFADVDGGLLGGVHALLRRYDVPLPSVRCRKLLVATWRS